MQHLDFSLIVYYNHRSSSHIQHLDFSLIVYYNHRSSSHMQHGHLSIVYYNHRSSSHMQLLDIYLSYATTTCHPATCISIVIQLYYYHRPSIYLQCIYYPTTSSMFDHPTTYNIQPIFRVVLIYHFYTWSTDPKSQNSRNLLSIPTSCESAIIDRSSIHKRCCYKTVDFATAASQNGICITQGNCHETI